MYVHTKYKYTMNLLQRPFFPALEISNFHDIVIALEQVHSMMI